MDYVTLPDLRDVVRGFQLRMDAAQAISHVEVAASNGSTSPAAAEALRTFFVACANAADKAIGGSGSRVKFTP